MTQASALKEERVRPSGKVVVVTGASAGAGRAIAHAFARRHARIALIARGRRGLEAAASEVRRLGGEAEVFPVDVADADAVERTAEEVERRMGPIDIWVNNAMTTVFAPLWKIEAREFKRATEVTYLGVVYGTLAALKRMYPRNRGTIVQVGSALAYRSIPLQAPYCGAKHAIRGFTNSLRSEILHDKKDIQISMVQLPAMNTPQFRWCRNRLPNQSQPVPPIFQPEVAAEGVVRAVERGDREVRVGFSTTKAILGQKWIPGLLDRYLSKVAYSGQQTDEPKEENRKDNLFEPLDMEEDYGTHGTFDKRAKDGVVWMTGKFSGRVLWYLVILFGGLLLLV